MEYQRQYRILAQCADPGDCLYDFRLPLLRFGDASAGQVDVEWIIGRLAEYARWGDWNYVDDAELLDGAFFPQIGRERLIRQVRRLGSFYESGHHLGAHGFAARLASHGGALWWNVLLGRTWGLAHPRTDLQRDFREVEE